MKKTVVLAFLVVLSAQPVPAQTPPSNVIERFSYNTSLPILCWDSTWEPLHYSSALGVLVGDASRQFVLTCEHAVSVKDGSRKTLRYLSSIIITLMSRNGRPILTPASVIYADERRDLALLEFTVPRNSVAELRCVSTEECADLSTLSASREVLFFNYPNIQSLTNPYPVRPCLSRVVLADTARKQFLLDADLEHGQSGGPVYLLSFDGHTWTKSLVGIAQGVYTPRQDLNATNRANTLPLIDRYGREQFAIGISVEPIIDVLHAELHFH